MAKEDKLLPYSPQVIALAKENGIDESELETIEGTGKGGAILVGDVREHVKAKGFADDKDKNGPVTYIAKYAQLRLVRKSAYSKEVDGKVFRVPGESIRFEGGVFTTSDPEEIKFLDSHPNYGPSQYFIKVEKDVVSERAEYVKSLEQRVAELEAEKAKEQAGKVQKVETKAPAKPKGKGKPKF